jgi:hypothetical protein
MKNRVQGNEYPGFPGSPTRKTIEDLKSKLQEILAQTPPKTEKIIEIWRVLMEENRPKSFRPGPRRPR